MSDEIYHYGIKGMKWGVRRKREKRSSEDKMRSAAKVGVALTGAVFAATALDALTGKQVSGVIKSGAGFVADVGGMYVRHYSRAIAAKGRSFAARHGL